MLENCGEELEISSAGQMMASPLATLNTGDSSGSGEEAVAAEDDAAFEDALPSTEDDTPPGHMSPTPHSKPNTPLKQQNILGL